ncbi:MAG: DNA/RNA nuclease SfsA [Gammaproteobacteria bacterium]|nr:DNA/RNA nuclease SfsA [Gammaproteobacteria bacterium]
MKFDGELQEGIFVRRYKRFFVDVATPEGLELTVHCANTGAMTGCNTPGNRMWYSSSSNPRRKLKHSIELVETDERHLVCVNTARANQLVAEILEHKLVYQVPENEQFLREITIPGERGRFDFGNETTVIEVKSVTWGHCGIGRFPDARSSRATRHVRALQSLAMQGYTAILFFAVLHTGVETVTVASEVDVEYAEAMREALKKNVRVFAYRWRLSPTEMTLDQEIPFYFESS